MYRDAPGDGLFAEAVRVDSNQTQLLRVGLHGHALAVELALRLLEGLARIHIVLIELFLAPEVQFQILQPCLAHQVVLLQLDQRGVLNHAEHLSPADAHAGQHGGGPEVSPHGKTYGNDVLRRHIHHPVHPELIIHHRPLRHAGLDPRRADLRGGHLHSLRSRPVNGIRQRILPGAGSAGAEGDPSDR